MTRILVTNDDGVQSPGLHALAEMAVGLGHEVVVAAPAGESSGSSASIMAREQDGRIVVRKHVLPDLGEVSAFAVEATPALIVLIATRGAFGDPPDLVLSGVNRGANFGHAIIHSGTVGAALTAAAYGCPALAVSLDVGLNAGPDPHWTTATRIAADLVEVALKAPHGIAFNLNVPDAAEVRGLREAHLADFGAVQTNLEIGDGYVRTTIADRSDELDPGTDAAVLADGYASVTPIRGITEASDLAAAARRQEELPSREARRRGPGG